jgi:hypothetical protein
MLKINELKHFFLIGAVLFIAVSFTGAYYSDGVATSNNIFTAGTWTPGPATITEVLYDPTGTDSGLEWIELKNTGEFTIDLNGYVLHCDNIVTANDFVFPIFSLLPNSRVVIHLRSSGTNTATDLYWPDTGGANMGNSYGSVGLFKDITKDPSVMVDFVQYGAGDQDGEEKAKTAGIWTEDNFVADVAEGHSIQLVSADNNSASDWFDQITPNPGS